jgi:hypothetical protein
MFNAADPGLLQLARWMRKHDVEYHVTPQGIERMVKAYGLAMRADYAEALEIDGMKELSGKISDKIRGGKLPKDVEVIKTDRVEPPPSSRAVRDGSGRSLGSGAERRRNGGAS